MCFNFCHSDDCIRNKSQSFMTKNPREELEFNKEINKIKADQLFGGVSMNNFDEAIKEAANKKTKDCDGYEAHSCEYNYIAGANKAKELMEDKIDRLKSQNKILKEALILFGDTDHDSNLIWKINNAAKALTQIEAMEKEK